MLWRARKGAPSISVTASSAIAKAKYSEISLPERVSVILPHMILSSATDTNTETNLCIRTLSRPIGTRAMLE